MTACSRAVLALALCGLVSCGDDAEDASSSPSRPRILRFEPLPPAIRAGEKATLHVEVEHATSLSLTDDSGEPLPLEKAGGTLEVSPSRSALYLLEATGAAGGKDLAYAQVVVDGPLQELHLAAVPSSIASGDMVRVLWSVRGERDVTLHDDRGERYPLPPGARSGVLELRPARTTRFTLTAQGAGEPITRDFTVDVAPVLESFTATPEAAKPGETIVLSWRTRGATSLSLVETLFGELRAVNEPGEIDTSSFEWTIPKALPDGTPLAEGTPLRFTLEARTSTPAVTRTASIDGLVGEGARIDLFEAPEAVTAGKSVSVRWRTRNAAGLKLLANGLTVYSPLSGDKKSITEGSRTFASPAAETVYTLEVTAPSGQRTRAERRVKPVKVPAVVQFQAPVSVPSAGTSALATWEVTDASRVQIRIEDGPTVFNTRAPGQLAKGNHALFPARSTQYVLEAWNDAGDVARATRRINVAAPAKISVTPDVAGPGASVTLSYTLQGQAVTQVLGIPDPAPVEDDTLKWVELDGAAEAKALTFADVDEGVALVMTPGFTFPFIDGLRESFLVSTNGFVAFDTTGALGTNTALPNPALPSLVAAYWDDLTLGAKGKVLWMVEGRTFPRRLVIEWSDVALVGDPSSALSFQVQLFETGEFRTLYRSLKGAAANGAGATIGAHLGGGRFPVGTTHSPGALTVSSGKALAWFANAAPTGVWTQKVDRHSRFSVFARTTSGGYLSASLPVWIFSPGSVGVTEAMPLPAPAVENTGAWVELRNNDASPVDLGGLVLESKTAGSSFALPPGTRVEPGGFLLIGQSQKTTESGGAPVKVAYGNAFAMAPSDVLTLSAGETVLSTLEWTGAQPGRSVQEPERAVDSSGTKIGCKQTQTFGPDGAVGTPGALNETCFAYLFSPTASAFRDISGLGMKLFPTGSLDSQIGTLDLSAHPVPLFGDSATELKVGTNGFACVGCAPSSFYAFPGVTKPDSSTPPKAFAIFGDDLTGALAFPEANVYALWVPPGADPQAPGGHWIVQWSHVTSYYAEPDDDLSFELKLFEDGVVEYHYGALLPNPGSTTPDDSRGGSATIWVEDGAKRALVVSANTPSLSSNTAYRFVPVAKVGVP